MGSCCGFQPGLGAHGHLCIKRALQVGVESFFRIEFRTIAGQVEQFELVFMCFDPGLDRLAVMDTLVIKYQKHFLAGILDQGLQEFNQLVRVE